MWWADYSLSLVFFGLTAALFAFVGIRDRYNGLLSDSYVYLAAAAEFGRGTEADLGLLRHVFEAYPFPPLFPLVLGALGGGTLSPARSYLVGALLLAAALTLFARWLRSVGFTSLAAVGLAVMVALLPVVLQTAMGVLSEPLFMLLMFAAALRLHAEEPARGDWYLAALLVGLAVLVRSIGVAAILAFGVCWTLRRGWHRARGALLVAVLPMIGWQLCKHFAGFFSYTMPGLRDRHEFHQLAINARALAHYALHSVDLLGRTHSALVLSVVGVVALLMLCQRLWRVRFDAWYVATYLLMILVWPYPDHAARFLLVIAPFLLAYAALGAVQAIEYLQRATVPAAAMLVPLLLLLVELPSTLSMLGPLAVHRQDARGMVLRSPAWNTQRGKAADSAAAFEARLARFQQTALQAVPKAACVASIIPQQVLVYGPRRGLDLGQRKARGEPLDATLAACPYVLMVAVRPFPAVGGIDAMYPFQRINTRMEVIAFERDRPADADSPLIAMLARVR